MTAAARGPGTCPRCLRPRPSARARARPDRRALDANPRVGSLDLAAGLLERAYSGSGEAGLSAEWFVAMLRALSGVRPISSPLPATEILPRGAGVRGRSGQTAACLELIHPRHPGERARGVAPAQGLGARRGSRPRRGAAAGQSAPRPIRTRRPVPAARESSRSSSRYRSSSSKGSPRRISRRIHQSWHILTTSGWVAVLADDCSWRSHQADEAGPLRAAPGIWLRARRGSGCALFCYYGP